MARDARVSVNQTLLERGAAAWHKAWQRMRVALRARAAALTVQHVSDAVLADVRDVNHLLRTE